MKKSNIFILKSLLIFWENLLERCTNFILIKLLKITITINIKDTAPKKSSLLLIFKISKKNFNESFTKYVSGLIKILIKGISIAMEIDSDNEEKIDKNNRKNKSLFLLESK
tara:strand:+ start:277 stop:609 length:333 start_codon:yes stop_codon:yes gene_type:complete